MTLEFKLPDLGEQIERGDVVEILVSVGDIVSLEQAVMEVETEKASMEIPCSVEGRVTDILVSVGDSIAVGQTVLVLEPTDHVVEKPESETQGEVIAEEKTDSSHAPIVPFIIPDMGEDATSGQVVDILVSVGDHIAVEQGVLEVETEKATVEIPSDVSGVVQEILVKSGDTIEAGQSVLLVMQDDTDKSKPAVEVEAGPTEEKGATSGEAPLPVEKVESPEDKTPGGRIPGGRIPDGRIPVFAAPSVRKFAREIGVDLSLVKGSGPGGKISSDDVKRHARTQKPASAPSANHGEPAAGKDVTRQPMNNIRKVTARAMSASWTTIPHVTLHRMAFVDHLEADRKRFKSRVADAGGKLTMTAIMLKLTASALKVHPGLNASLDLEKQELVRNNRIHVGVAVDTPRGLVVPVIRDANQKPIVQLAAELSQLSARARDGKLSLDDMSGATFTITNLGGMGIEFFTPIINTGQVGILGLGRARTRAEFVDGVFAPRMVMPLSLSFDHRAVDGADGARFLGWLSDAMESSFLTLLEG